MLSIFSFIQSLIAIFPLYEILSDFEVCIKAALFGVPKWVVELFGYVPVAFSIFKWIEKRLF